MNTIQRAFCLLIALSLLSVPSLSAESKPVDDGGCVQIFLVRHCEKDTRVGKNPPLSPAGWKRAEQLSHVLGSSGVTHLFSSDYARTQMTLTPLARGLGAEITIYDVRKPKDLVAKLFALPQGSVAVVAGHSNTTPQLYQALGASAPKGLDKRGFLSEKAYDRLFSVTLNSDGQTAERDRKFNRIVPPPDVPDRSSFREIVPLRSSRVKSEADKMAASAIARPG
ncbi:MAG: phosphoglycerate mutase family protein, partial [Planctomycetota bacterium]|nr:phosphoglycerate mutase family protein [Planctomycetota bacterium]